MKENRTTVTNHGAAIALPEPVPPKDFDDSGRIITDPDWRWNQFAPVRREAWLGEGGETVMREVEP